MCWKPPIGYRLHDPSPNGGGTLRVIREPNPDTVWIGSIACNPATGQWCWWTDGADNQRTGAAPNLEAGIDACIAAWERDHL